MESTTGPYAKVYILLFESTTDKIFVELVALIHRTLQLPVVWGAGNVVVIVSPAEVTLELA